MKKQQFTSEEQSEKPKDITLKNVPADVWDRIRLIKIKMLQSNKNRVGVSHQEAVFKIIRGCEI
jgi:hypothetical protein